MAEDTRRLQPVKIGMTSVEIGRQRFTKDNWFHAPPVSHWRNNLTALSQRYNLYFIATESSIAVYKPNFPFQTLGGNPCLTIPPTVEQADAEGYIDTRHKHTINQIIVGDLGTEEVLLVATDSGNVAAYHTKSVRDALEKDPYKFNEDARSDFVGVRAFFSQWVHESAWGLAIHKRARMIAVSANTPHHHHSEDDCAKVTVFAFALAEDIDVSSGDEEADDVEEDEAEWKTWKSAQPVLADRSRNYKVVLSGHTHNIPNISFVNSNHDRDGRWLVSTDIGGKMTLWNVWANRAHKTWDFSRTHEDPRWPTRDAYERGWSILALDPASFIPTDTLEEFSGLPKPLKYLMHEESRESYNTTNFVRNRIPNTREFHPALGVVDTDDGDSGGSMDEMFEEWSDDEPADGEAGGVLLDYGEHSSHSNAASRSGADPGPGILLTTPFSPAEEEEAAQLAEGMTEAQADHALNLLNPDDDSDYDEEDDEEDDSDENEAEDSPMPDALDRFDEEQEERPARRTHSHAVPRSEPFSPAAEPQFFSSSLEQEQNLPISPPRKKSRLSESYSKMYTAYMRATAQKASSPENSIPHLPVLHCSGAHIRLLNAPMARYAHFFCGSALKQVLPQQFEMNGFSHIDRMNMTQYIPELGIVIVGTQLGRCAVITLTKHPKTGALGFRVDWIVPTKKQEQAGNRPTAPLLGIATAPVQGRETPSDPDSDESVSSDESSNAEEDQEIVHSGEEDNATSASESEDQQAEGDVAVHRSRRSGESSKPSSKSSSTRSDSGSENTKGKAHRSEPWRGVEYSRRYRLMLTFYDQTVMTYELMRETPELDIHGRKNHRNRSGLMI